mgnify:CR=1 FL=1
MLITPAIPAFTPAINADNARELQKKGVEARKRNKELQRLAAIGATVTEVKPVIDALGDKFARALEDTLDQYLASSDATERAKIARSMREVRETYHLYSGAPKPGTIKPVSQRPKPQHRELPDAPDSQ